MPTPPFQIIMPSSFDEATVTVESPLDLGSGRFLVRKAETSPIIARSAGDYKAADVTAFVDVTVAGASVAQSFISEDVSTADATSYTFAGKTLGTGKIYVEVAMQGDDPTACTIGGEAASIVTDGVTSASVTNGGSRLRVYVADVSAATGDIVVQCATGAIGCAIRWRLVTNQTAVSKVVATTLGSGSSIATPWEIDLSLPTPAGGLMFACAHMLSNNSGHTVSYSGVTQRGTAQNTDTNDLMWGGDADGTVAETRAVALGSDTNAVRVTGIAIALS